MRIYPLTRNRFCAPLPPRDRTDAIASCVLRFRNSEPVNARCGTAERRGLCLWPHTSVNLDKAYDDARKAIGCVPRMWRHTSKNFSRLVLSLRVDTTFRRAIFATGTVRYCSVADLARVLDEDPTNADGVIVVPLCETAEEHRAALTCAKHAFLKKRETLLLAVPQPLNNLASLVQEARRWEWVSTNVLELNADKYARNEVARQKNAARLQLEQRIQSFVSFQAVSNRIVAPVVSQRPSASNRGRSRAPRRAVHDLRSHISSRLLGFRMSS